jgi:general secretion pathway protein M
MSAANVIRQVKDQAALYWMARTEQERKYLTIGGATVLGALVFMLFIDPALSGRDKLNAQLPQLRVEAATMQALAQEAAELAARPAPQVTPMTKDTLSASLAARSITPVSLLITGEFAKVQLTNVAFAGLYSWLDAERRENRIAVEDIAVTAGSPVGQVDVVLTLRQSTGEASR